MASKMITRTIKVYTYTTGRFNPATMTVENMRNTSFPYKLGARDRKKLEGMQGGQILSETTGEALYGMTLDDFIQHAHVLDPADVTDLA